MKNLSKMKAVYSPEQIAVAILGLISISMGVLSILENNLQLENMILCIAGIYCILFWYELYLDELRLDDLASPV